MANKLTIMGMTCSHCAQTVEKALAGVDGVESAQVNYLRKEARVQGEVDIEELAQAVEKAGYRAAAKKASGA
ncbi:MAG: heavy metal-associated domain-containing protein [Trueperaceae bacterium]